MKIKPLCHSRWMDWQLAVLVFRGKQRLLVEVSIALFIPHTTRVPLSRQIIDDAFIRAQSCSVDGDIRSS